MQAGVLCFFMGLVLFLIDNQPKEVRVTTLVIASAVFAALVVAEGMIEFVTGLTASRLSEYQRFRWKEA